MGSQNLNQRALEPKPECAQDSVLAAGDELGVDDGVMEPGAQARCRGGPHGDQCWGRRRAIEEGSA